MNQGAKLDNSTRNQGRSLSNKKVLEKYSDEKWVEVPKQPKEK